MSDLKTKWIKMQDDLSCMSALRDLAKDEIKKLKEENEELRKVVEAASKVMNMGSHSGFCSGQYTDYCNCGYSDLKQALKELEDSNGWVLVSKGRLELEGGDGDDL